MHEVPLRNIKFREWGVSSEERITVPNFLLDTTDSERHDGQILTPFFVANLSYNKLCIRMPVLPTKLCNRPTVAALRNLSGGRIISRRLSTAYLLNLTPFEYFMLGSLTESVPGGRAV
jgi:hypothetical protein